MRAAAVLTIVSAALLNSCAAASQPATCQRLVSMIPIGQVEQCPFEKERSCSEALAAPQRKIWKTVIFEHYPDNTTQGSEELVCSKALADLLGKRITLTGFVDRVPDVTNIIGGRAQSIAVLVPVFGKKWFSRNMNIHAIRISGAKQIPSGDGKSAFEGRLVFVYNPLKAYSNQLPPLALVSE